MIVVIYKFEIKPNKFIDFLKYWKKMTLLIHQYEKGLGSRLHKKEENVYIAYAQWPDRETWSNSGVNLPKEAEVIRNEMRKVCSKVTILNELEVVEDLLKTEAYKV